MVDEEEPRHHGAQRHALDDSEGLNAREPHGTAEGDPDLGGWAFCFGKRAINSKKGKKPGKMEGFVAFGEFFGV